MAQKDDGSIQPLEGSQDQLFMPTTLTADPKAVKRRKGETAETMATKQKDIAVSEFFAKNRHLLGFDNPRKALLTTVKEAVDNSLDACEEAGILPNVTIVIEDLQPDRPANAKQSRYRVTRHRQRPGHRPQAGGERLRPTAVRLQVPPPEDEPRPAGHRHQRRRHVRADHHRQADGDPHPPQRQEAGSPHRAGDEHQDQPGRSDGRRRDGGFPAAAVQDAQRRHARSRASSTPKISSPAPASASSWKAATRRAAGQRR